MSPLASELSFSPLFGQLLQKRGFQDTAAIESFLYAGLDHLEDPFLMKGMREAVARIHRAVRDREAVLIHGDYDVDGITAAAILGRTLRLMEAEVSLFLPERVRDGYGVSECAIREARARGVSFLITADCGIAAHDEIRVARDLGMDVLVLDHHNIPAQGLPAATIILNPQQEDCTYPCPYLSAAGLAFKLSQALLGEQSFQFLDLAALSTVCDVAPLISENRILVKGGLAKLASDPNLGLKALGDSAKMRTRQWNTGHLGFVLGPRINACGRMSTPDIALRLLMTENTKEAESLALVLEEENKNRQKEERLTTRQALLEAERTFHFNRDRILVVGDEGWHQGVVGIVASRLVDRFQRPALVIGFKGEMGKGSGRSIKGLNLFEALQACGDLFEEFGGHEQAVGLSLKKENLAALRQRINAYAHEKIPAEVFVSKTPFDLEIRLEDMSAMLIQELKMLEPHGAGNPRPVFLSRRLQIRGKPVKLNPQTVKLWLTDGHMTAEALWVDRFEQGAGWLKQGLDLDVYYAIKTRIWDGIESLVLDLKEVRPT